MPGAEHRSQSDLPSRRDFFQSRPITPCSPLPSSLEAAQNELELVEKKVLQKIHSEGAVGEVVASGAAAADAAAADPGIFLHKSSADEHASLFVHWLTSLNLQILGRRIIQCWRNILRLRRKRWRGTTSRLEVLVLTETQNSTDGQHQGASRRRIAGRGAREPEPHAADPLSSPAVL